MGNEREEVFGIFFFEMGEFVDEGVQEVDISALALAADVVNLSWISVGKDRPDGGGMVVHKNPIADVVAFAIDGKRLFMEAAVDHARNKFFDVLAGAVVIG